MNLSLLDPTLYAIVGPWASYTDRYHLSYQSHKITLEVNSHLRGKLAGSMFSHVHVLLKNSS